ncbi:uncharacterized protein F5891DRAFT_1189381 [Suillus fuscotomentosus]|uniref:Uncharacterized protein n=1 Tax=Suillus fuscotomentosus TaxID=1912939 RepID=A0AAD4E5E2_9AGAM|nr:uncharacterized protein F5891DRAFT_1189381 [Suillus fuscotomentosus]KAG1899900.1 hypothetical protein F5891DRAFT_1189381 [Suillus fuscotomentosus]
MAYHQSDHPISPTACPSISEVKLDFKHEDPDPEEIFELRFDLCQYIQIASTPDDMELKYSGPLLQHLTTINIVSRRMTHALSKEQKTSWHWLENTLYHAASVFSTDALLPMEFHTLPLPSSYGYLRDHKTHGHALRCAKRSRLAFHGLLGLSNLFYGQPPSPSQMLVESGLSESHVCDIISALQPEILGRCVGVVLDPRKSEWGHIFPYLNDIRAPVWVKVGRYRGAYDPKTFKADNFKTAVPREDEKIKVGSVISKTISEETSSDSSAVNPDSLHRWDAFVESRKQKQLDFQSHVSESIKERVRRRLEQASNFILPTRPDGTWFFLWYRSKKGRFRGEIDFEDARIEFETRPRGQLIYDELSNQWDVCSLFDSEPEATNDDLVDDTNNLTSNKIIPPISHPQLNSPPILPHNHNEIGRTIVYHGCIREDILFASSLEDVLHSRYGLLCCNQHQEINPELI